MNYKITYIILFAFSMMSVAFAEDWVNIGEGENGEKYYYDAGSVSKIAAYRFSYRGKVEFTSVASINETVKMRKSISLKTEGYSKLKFSFALEEIDCTLKKARNLETKDVDQNCRVLDQHKVIGPWEDFTTGSLYEILYPKICP